MANLRRGIAGAAQAGAALSMEQHRANIMAKRDQRLQEYDQQSQQQRQAYGTSERVAGQEFSAGENEKTRAQQLDLQALKNQKTTAEAAGKVPEYEKVLRKMSAETYNSSLGDAFNFEGDNADKAALLAQRSVEIYKGMEAPDTTVAYKQALDELRQQESQQSEDEIRSQPSEDEIRSIRSQVEKEAKDKAGFFSSDQSDFGMPRTDWINQQVQQRTGLLNGAASGMGSPSPSSQAQPSSVVQIKDDDEFNKLKSGTRFIGPDGRVRIKP